MSYQNFDSFKEPYIAKPSRKRNDDFTVFTTRFGEKIFYGKPGTRYDKIKAHLESTVKVLRRSRSEVRMSEK